MSNRNWIAVCLLVVGLVAASAEAQQVHFRGKVENGEAVCYYCPGTGFVVDCTKVRISSTAYNLQALVGQHIEADGVWNGSTTLPMVNITYLQVTNETFSIGGGANIGQHADFTAFGNPGDSAVVALALNVSVLNFGPPGLAFLHPSSAVVLGSGTMDSSGEFSVTVQIPNLPQLSGLNVFGQGFVVPLNGAPYVTNPDWKQL